MQIIATHKNTDFDALSSLYAATLLYPGAVPVIPKNININVKAFLSLHKNVFDPVHADEINIDSVSRLIVVDVNRWDRLEGLEKLKEKPHVEIILWDHHMIEGDIRADHSFQEEMGATTTLMIQKIREERYQLTPIQSTLFLAGIYEDTGNLSFPSTRPEDAYAAAYLLENRADLEIIQQLLRPAYGEKHKNILFDMLQSDNQTTINGFKIAFCTMEIEGHVPGLSLLVNMYRDLLNVDVAFGIFNICGKDKCIIIGRSNTSELNMGYLMKSIGGGGHPGAGSAMLRSVRPEAVVEMISELIEGNKRSSVKITDLMSFPVSTVSSDTTMQKTAERFRKEGFTGFPVVENGRISGIISRRDFKKINNPEKLKSPVKAFMSKNVKTIAPDTSPMEAVRLMVKYDIGRLPVVEDGEIIGIVTRSDTMMYFYDLLPE